MKKEKFISKKTLLKTKDSKKRKPKKTQKLKESKIEKTEISLNEFSTRLKTALGIDKEAIKINFTAFAKQCKVNPESARMYVYGRVFPNFTALLNMSKVYGSDFLHYLFFGEYPKCMEISPTERKLIENYRTSNPNTRKSVEYALHVLNADE